jgi:hypothetical protein
MTASSGACVKTHRPSLVEKQIPTAANSAQEWRLTQSSDLTSISLDTTLFHDNKFSGDPIDQTREPLPADALCDAELGEMRSGGVGHPRAMLDQHGAGTMQDERALLLDGLDLREPHVWARDGFANRFASASSFFCVFT